MRSIIRPVGLLATALMVLGPSSTRSDDSPKVDPKAAEAVDRVLGEWHQRASKMTSLAVSFQSTQASKDFGTTRGYGHLILALPNLAMFDHARLDEKCEPTPGRERIVWSGRATFQFDQEQSQVFRRNYREEPSPPSYLCLPFLFGIDPKHAKRDHEWQILSEDQSQVVLKAIPRKPEQSVHDLFSTKGSWARTTFAVILVKKSYLPRKVIFYSTDRDYTIYELADIKVNAKVDIESLKNPSLEGWNVKSTGHDSVVKSRFRSQLSFLSYLLSVWPR